MEYVDSDYMHQDETGTYIASPVRDSSHVIVWAIGIIIAQFILMNVVFAYYFGGI